ncbi:WGR domain-containing protein [Endozoicomonas sp. SM1973]|uniref:WGR domain-containing protein n=1 Tax=Spartinivicinus marinus TaxID=2994442 RepID=A0A853IKD9_9GAMM|nr:WGR domain-containing protein [Spartinivicinus marinus]MCX4030343.1 WGR domain-containing protein [Spartinivicinus marinus]NYZ69545.1 WGR domain-containing protein [Spartinivicinus marinus]
MIYLKLSDPETNTHKFYTLLIQKDLFGHWALLRQWGRIGTKGTIKVDTFDCYEKAHAALERIQKQKLRKGYFLKHSESVTERQVD